MNKLQTLKYKIFKMTKQTAIYILLLNDGKHYCGITNCIERRLKQHQNGKSKYTSKHLPVKLVWLSWTDTRSEARQIEELIKNRGVSKWLTKYGQIHKIKDNGKIVKCKGPVLKKM